LVDERTASGKRRESDGGEEEEPPKIVPRINGGAGVVTGEKSRYLAVAEQEERTQSRKEEGDAPQEGQVWGEVEVRNQPVVGKGTEERGEEFAGN
jgi:hypothetical protein